MSAPTITRQPYQIREGMSGPVDAKHPFIEAVVDRKGVATAFEHAPTTGEKPYWLLVTYQDVSDFAGVGRATAIRCDSADHAREWIHLLGALYAKARAADVQSGEEG